MGMMEKKRMAGLCVGSSSILVIFVLLCLTAFASLSLVSARGDYRLTQNTAESVRAYYEADARGVELLAALTQNPMDAQQLGWTAVPEGLERRVPLTERQELWIVVRADTLQIVRWQVQSVGERAEAGMPGVWDGTLPFGLAAQ